MIKQQLKLLGEKIKRFFIRKTEPVKFFNAEEAYLTTQRYDNPYVLRIFNKGIIPATKSGKYNCKVDFLDDVPEEVINLFKNNGYSVTKSLHFVTGGVTIVYLNISWER